MIQAKTPLALLALIFQVFLFATAFAQCPEFESIELIYNCDDESTDVLIAVTDSVGVMYSVDGGSTFQDSNTFYDQNPGDYLVVITQGNLCYEVYTFQIPEPVSTETEEFDLEVNFNCNSELIISSELSLGRHRWYRNGEFIEGEYESQFIIDGNTESGEYHAELYSAGVCYVSTPYYFSNEGLSYFLNPDGWVLDCTITPGLVPYSINVQDALAGQSNGSFTIEIDTIKPFVFSIDGGDTFVGCNQFDNLEAGTYEVIISDGFRCIEIEVVVPEFVSTAIVPLNVYGSSCRVLRLSVDKPDATNFRWYRNGLVLQNEIGSTLNVSKFLYESGDIFYATFSSPQGGFTTEEYELEFLEYYTDLGHEFICEGDTAFFGGLPIFTEGLYQANLVASDGCDSIVVQKVVVLPDEQCGDFFISGSLFYDANRNGFYDSNERGVPNVPLNISSANLMLLVSYNGYFHHFAEEGVAYTIGVDLSEEPAGKWEITTAESEYSIVFDKENPDHKNLNIGLVHKEDFYEGQLHFNPFGSRCNKEEDVKVFFRNLGTEILDDEVLTINVELDPKYSFIESDPMPSFQDGNIFTYEFSGLKTFSQTTIDLVLDSPDESHTGETYRMVSSAVLSRNGEEILLADYEKVDTVRCSYDPNDKQVFPAGVDDEHYTLIGEKLTYTVRFQNTGNDVAYDVKIKDVLDENLDLETFKILGSSHEMSTTFNKNEVEFLFKNIQLPDSTSNEPLSHGYVIYEVSPLEGLEDYTLIENTADIFFDLNPPIVTNTTKNLMVEELPVSSVLELNGLDFEATLSGNRNVLLEWNTEANYSTKLFVLERRTEGQDWAVLGTMESTAAKHQYLYTDMQLTSGIYYYRIRQVGMTGSYTFSKIRSVQVDGADGNIIFPNPINRNQVLTILASDVDIQKCTITDMKGAKVIESLINKGQKTISISKLLPGVYICELEGSGYKSITRLMVY